jgi:hypothetical protein
MSNHIEHAPASERPVATVRAVSAGSLDVTPANTRPCGDAAHFLGPLSALSFAGASLPCVDVRCRSCGYGAIIGGEEPACPMCHDSNWQRNPGRSLAHTNEVGPDTREQSLTSRIAARARETSRSEGAGSDEANRLRTERELRHESGDF